MSWSTQENASTTMATALGVPNVGMSFLPARLKKRKRATRWRDAPLFVDRIADY
jgi:hypothetical protein